MIVTNDSLLVGSTCLGASRFCSVLLDGRTLRAEELSGDVEGLAAHDHDLLAIEQLLRDRAGQATEQMALSVNDLMCVRCMLAEDDNSSCPRYPLGNGERKRAYVQ